MIELLIKSYHNGGLQLAVIVGLVVVVVHLWKEQKKLYSQLIRSEKRHAKEIRLLSFRLKQVKQEPYDYDDKYDRPTGEYSLTDLINDQQKSLEDFQGDADEIEEALKDLSNEST